MFGEPKEPVALCLQSLCFLTQHCHAGRLKRAKSSIYPDLSLPTQSCPFIFNSLFVQLFSWFHLPEGQLPVGKVLKADSAWHVFILSPLQLQKEPNFQGSHFLFFSPTSYVLSSPLMVHTITMTCICPKVWCLYS